MSHELTGKRALVTGSSRGIGSAIALELARSGAHVILHCSGESAKMDEMRQQILALGQSCSCISADLRDAQAVQTLAKEVGAVDILVLNASVQYRKVWNEITPEEFHDQMNCNVLSSLLLIQHMVPAMQAQHWGRIITIGSVQETKPHPQMLIYSSSKAAQTAMAKSLALQLAPDGITVNNIAPGVIDTDRNKDALKNESYAQLVVQSIPMGFVGQKEECAGMVRLLCTEQGRYITGQNIFIDGGKGL